MSDRYMQEVSGFRRSQAEKSLYAFAKQYLGHHLKLEPSPAHHEIYGLLESLIEKRGKRVAIAAPRGFGKSTLITLLYILYATCYQRERYVMILSNTSSQAEQILENIKKELEENEKIQRDFPELFGMNGRKRKPRWSRDQIETSNGVKIQALGSGEKPRGRRYGKYRPSLIIADDIETAENAATELARDKMKTWFKSTVLMLGDNNTNYIFMGTLYHPLCLLNEYLSPNFNLEWDKRLYKVILHESSHPDFWAKWSEIYNNRQPWREVRGKAGAEMFYSENKELMDEGVVLLWPERWSYQDLQIFKEEHEHAFYCELQGEPYDLRAAIFNVDKFSYIEKEWPSVDALLTARRPHFDFFGSCDPCLGSDSTRGDFSAITIAARDRENGTVYIIESDIRRMSPQETIDRIIALYRLYYPSQFFIETNNFGQLMFSNLEEQLKAMQLYMPVASIVNAGNKAIRIHSLDSLIKRGRIKFSLTHERLLTQFRSFPSGEHDDGPDSVSLLMANLPEYTGATVTSYPIVYQSVPLRDPVFSNTPLCGSEDYTLVRAGIVDRFVPPDFYNDGKEFFNAQTINMPLFQAPPQRNPPITW